MSQRSAGPEILRLIELIARLPGLGPRSARRAALFLLKRRDTLLKPLAEALAEAGEKIEKCEVCGNFDTVQPCAVCQADGRDDSVICVVEDVPDLWALERSGAHRGRCAARRHAPGTRAVAAPPTETRRQKPRAMRWIVIAARWHTIIGVFGSRSFTSRRRHSRGRCAT